MVKDYYTSLEIEKNANDEEIKKAYRKLSKKYHPDLNQSNPKAEEKFKEIAEAYEVLSDKEKKQNYDMYGSPEGRGHNPFNGGPINMEDLFDNFFGGTNPFNGRSNHQRKNKGSDIRVNIQLNLYDILTGVEKKIKYKKNESCGGCKGSGGKSTVCTRCKGRGMLNQIQNTPFGRLQSTVHCPVCKGEGHILVNRCTSCGGIGIIKKEEILEFIIPPGIMDGEILALAGKGNAIKNGNNGDLLINIIEIPHPKFRRNGIDIHQRLNLKYKDLVLGAPIELETLDGKIRINIKKGTQVGHILRVPSKGLKRDNRVGDMLVEIWLEIPTEIKNEERSIIDQL